MKLDEIKREYEKLTKKYDLPNFEKLNSDFEVDKLEKETENILRSFRKLMMEKIVNSMTFLEMLVNPVNAPRMYLSYLRNMSIEDRKIIDDIYTALADLSLLSLDLEIDSNEKSEADLLKKGYEKWNSLKPGFRKILENMKKPNNNLNNLKKERSYFG
ncbi:MAG: hypothetical protein Q7S27_03085 [Nanoarchaeota archaeon]|nr:hypothetical protein [Nanoarchaeota archaeon]